MGRPVARVGKTVNLTTDGQISPGPCMLLGLYVNSITDGGVTLVDGPDGGPILAFFIPNVGWNEFPTNFGTYAQAYVDSTQDITFSFIPT